MCRVVTQPGPYDLKKWNTSASRERGGQQCEFVTTRKQIGDKEVGATFGRHMPWAQPRRLGCPRVRIEVIYQISATALWF